VRFLKSSFFLAAALTTLSADSFLSEIKEESFKLQEEKIDAERSKLRSSWIEPIELLASKNYNNQFGSDQKTTIYKISINQPIFKSGGILYGIRYANAKGKYDLLSVKEQRRTLIKEAVSLLFKIKQADFQKSRQEFVLENARIDLLRKREQYENGQIDSGFLDNAVLAKNSAALTLLDIQSSKNELIAAFRTLSDIEWEKATLPVLESLTKEEYLEQSLELKRAEADVLQSDFYKSVTIAKYLPTFRLSASYNDVTNENFAFGNGINFSTEDGYYQYGLSASWKFLDVNILKDIESAKLSNLRAKNAKVDLENSLYLKYTKILDNIENIDKKLELTKEDRALYEKLSHDTKELYDAGHKSIYDVQTLENSAKIQSLNLEILLLEKQLLLLELYEKSEREL